MLLLRRALLASVSSAFALVLLAAPVDAMASTTMRSSQSSRGHQCPDARHHGGRTNRPCRTVLVYFTPSPVGDCSVVEPFRRPVKHATPAAALQALLKGPTASERAAGYNSFFSPATAGALNSVTVRHGVARVDLADLRQVIPNASTSCGSAELLAQLDATVLQFPSIKRVVYSFNGDVAAFYDFLQLVPPPGY